MKKLIAKALIISLVSPMLFLSLPQKSYAYAGIADVVIDPVNLVQNTIGAVANVKSILLDFVLKGIAWRIGNLMLQKLTAQTVNWINSGFKGNPAYVSDPGQFFLNIGDNEVNRILSGTQFNSLCSPFKAQVRLQLVKNYLNETDNSANYTCTLSKVAQNYEGFMQDFSQGGWEGWFEVTQTPQNNPYGAYLVTKDALSKSTNVQVGKYKTQLTQGNGFLSYEKCDSGGAPIYDSEHNVSDEQGREAAHQECLDNGGDLDTCDAELAQAAQDSGQQYVEPSCHTVTPGSVINAGLNKALGSTQDREVMVNDINQIISALMEQLIGKVIGSTGLLGVSQSGSATGGKTNRSFLSQLNPNSVENQTDNASAIKDIVDSADPSLKSSVPTPAGAPVIVLNGINPTNVTSADEFVDPGAQAFSASFADISDKITTTLGATTPVNSQEFSETFTVTYRVTDSTGKSANPVTRVVNVINTSPSVDNTNGECGTANANIPANSDSFGSLTFCAAGTPDPTPTFPANPGGSVNWICRGSGSGVDSPICEAKRLTTNDNAANIGKCGPIAHTYTNISPVHAYYTDVPGGPSSTAYCSVGTPSGTPPFPSVGDRSTWTCKGINGSPDSPMCTASRP